MPRVTYVEAGGARHEVEGPVGVSVMQAAVNHGIEGVVAECGGGLACATCHCIVEDPWIDSVGPPSEIESQMLDFAASDRGPGSRLSCQILLNDDLDGLTVRLPESQF